MTLKETIELVLSFAKLLISWPIVIFSLVVLFRKQITNSSKLIIDRLTKLKTSFVEIDLEPKTIQTNLGQTEISKVTVKQSSVGVSVIEGFQEMYICDNYLISWPKAKWEGNNTINEEAFKLIGLGNTEKRKFSLFIGCKEKIRDFQPNVNVMLELTTYNSIKKLLPYVFEQYAKIGWQVFSSNIDNDDQGGFVEYHNPNNKVALYQFQRFALAFGRLYVVTASVPTPMSGEEIGIIEDLSSIVNSFRIIV